MKELLYIKIYSSIKNDISSGKLTEGTRIAGVRELAVEWDTSANTILKALDELETGGFIRKIQGRGIFVQAEAVWNKDPGAERELELILYDMDVPFNRRLISSVEKAAADFGFRLTVKSSDCSGGLPAPRSGGRIIVPSSVPEDIGLAETRLPVIYIGDFRPSSSFKADYAVVDLYGGFFRAAEFLLSSGRERLAYIGASADLEEEAGWNACRDVLSGSRHGFNREYAVSAGGWEAAHGQAAMEKLLLDGEFPDGLLCCNDTLAAGALKACRAVGLSVPDDIAVIGAGDQDIAALLDPPLTSLKIPADVLGLTAVSFIDSILNKRPGSGERLRARFDTELLVRESATAFEDESLWL